MYLPHSLSECGREDSGSAATIQSRDRETGLSERLQNLLEVSETLWEHFLFR